MTTPRSKAAPNQSARDFDVVVVGGGHAGVEAALAATRIGAATAVVVMDATAFGRMSCNPAIGGLAKGQLVREVDALGGEMGLCTDEAGIQFRMLNTRKGPAVRSPRAQCDRKEYNRAMVRRVLAQPGLEIIEAEAVDLVTRTKSHGARAIDGVRLADGSSIHAPAVVLTTGTFLGGKLFAGTWEREGGRYGEAGATALSRALSRLDLRLGRHKTGTPPRLDRDSIDWSGLVEQPGDAKPQPFSFRTERLELEQVSCFTTHTNARTHAIIRDNAHHSPMVTGRIQGSGPRYCPSVEDKVVRFADKDSHLIFLEPEGRDTRDVYPNGISTSLPIEVQHKFLRTIRGLEEVTVLQPGYAVEYDHLATDQIRADLQVGGVAGLFAAGQINGTSGYEEAAGQGLMAGINAVRFAPWRRCIRARPRVQLPGRDDRRPMPRQSGRALPDVHQSRRVPAASAQRQRGPTTDTARRAARLAGRRPWGCRASKRAANRSGHCDVGQLAAPNGQDASRDVAPTRVDLERVVRRTCRTGRTPTRATRSQRG